ncbi:Imm1 family immunity protein [Salinispora mooreana]|uniref:Imm1 family immunity protein n=1 Tax=Salinispora mooreana TaxID=999545 RepID=UPI000381B29D|nr:Imm1 family immunity protein [Salinispora mooreana]
MSYVVTWGRGNRRPGSTIAEVDTALNDAAASGVPQVVGIYPPQHLAGDASPWDAPLPPALQIGVGHPDRSFVLWLGPEGGIGVEAGAPPWPDGTPDIAFDYGGDAVFAGPDRARVTPDTARQAAREFVRTGQRPTCVQWTNEQ